MSLSSVTNQALQRNSIRFVSRKLLTAHRSLLTVFAQSPEPADVLKIDTDLVNLNVSVFNKTPRDAAALAQKDFAVLDNGAPQEISFFASGESPFDLVLL